MPLLPLLETAFEVELEQDFWKIPLPNFMLCFCFACDSIGSSPGSSSIQQIQRPTSDATAPGQDHSGDSYREGLQEVRSHAEHIRGSNIAPKILEKMDNFSSICWIKWSFG